MSGGVGELVFLVTEWSFACLTLVCGSVLSDFTAASSRPLFVAA